MQVFDNTVGVAGTSFSSLKINHIPHWDKWELWAFNCKALMLVAWPTWAVLTILRSRINFPLSLQPSFVGSVSPWTSSLAAGVLQLSEKAGFWLESTGWHMESHSFAFRVFVGISTATIVCTVVVVIGAIFNLR